MIGTSQVAKAEPDGHTIGVSIAGPLVLNRLLYKSMTYDPQKDLTPLTFGVHQPCMLIANKSLGVSSVSELIALVKKNPGKFNYGYVGNGSLGHLVMAMLAEKSGTQIVPILYGAAPPAALALLAGDVHMACLPASVAYGQVKGGGVTALAVSTEARTRLLPNLPTIQEQGYPDIVGSAWIGFVGPAGLPKALTERISREIGGVLREPEVVETLRQQFMEPAPTTPEEFRRFMADQLQKWMPVIEQNNIRAD
jgi:tripartite-type tricarboxylate transporter receptor subunit TctC